MATIGVGKAKPRRVQEKSFAPLAVKSIASERHPETLGRRGVEPDLMGAAGQCFEAKARTERPLAFVPPLGHSQLAEDGVDHLARAVLGIEASPELDATAGGTRPRPRENAQIALLDLPFLKGPLKEAVGVEVFGRDQKAGGRLIQAVSHPNERTIPGEKGLDVVGTGRALPGNGEKSVRLVDDDQPSVLVDDGERRFQS